MNQSLEDNYLDVSERHDLADLLITLEIDEKRYLRNQAFDVARDHLKAGWIIIGYALVEKL